MKIFFVFILFFSSMGMAEEDGLPFESDLKRLALQKVGIGHGLELNFTLKIPDTQKLNHGAPSNVTIFEKSKNEKTWAPTKAFNLNEKTFFEGKINFKEQVVLKNSDSEVVVHATVYHCGKIDSRVPCFIQGFQGIVKRSKKVKSNSVQFIAEGKVY